MIEILNIFIQLFLYLVIFTFPINSQLISYAGLKKYTIYDFFLINFVIFSTFSIFFSLTNIDSQILFFFYLGLGLIFLINELKKNKNNYLNIFFLFFVLLNLSIFVKIASNPYLNWDGLATWAIKMNNFYFDIEYKNLKNITYSHQPHLGTFLWAFFYKNSLIEYEYVGRFFYVFIFLSSIFSLKSNFTLNNYNSSILFFLLFITILSFDLYLLGGYQEYLLFSLILYTANYLFKLDSLQKINILNVIFFSLLLNLINWSKQEGLAYIVLLQIIFFTFKNISWSNKVLSAFLFFLLFMIKVNFSFNDPLSDPHLNFDKIYNYEFKILIYKIIYISKHLIIAFIKYPIWLLIILSFFSILIKNYNGVKFFKKILLFSFLNIGLIYFIFLTTSNFEWMVKVTLDRIVFQTTGFYILICIIMLKEKLSK